jgi:transposase
MLFFAKGGPYRFVGTNNLTFRICDILPYMLLASWERWQEAFLEFENGIGQECECVFRLTSVPSIYILVVQMSNPQSLYPTPAASAQRRLSRLTVGPFPFMHDIAKRMKLREILSRYIKRHGNEIVDPVDTLLVLIYNLTIGKAPLYELEQWCESIDLERIGIRRPSTALWNDDRFGKVLDKLYIADRASLMTELVMAYITEFDLTLTQIHNDSTSLKAFGSIGGTTITGLHLSKGHSKDHRPDLKQLIYSLSITADGGVPIHHRCYPGNYTDDKTHIETWNILRSIADRADFLYVADCKVCTDKQLRHIVKSGGKVITIVPETWKEIQQFKDDLRQGPKAKKIIWRRLKPGSEFKKEYFSVFAGDHKTYKRQYPIHWIYSSEKRKRDRTAREQSLEKAEGDLTKLNARINTRKLTSFDDIRIAVEGILRTNKVSSLIHYRIDQRTLTQRKQVGKGRPSKNTSFHSVKETIYSLSWSRDRIALRQEARIDGIFPLLCTDANLPAIDVLKAYKYQPCLEKRFCQFKSIHNGAPLLFKKIQRVEANMFAFFIALVIQSLFEREVRKAMKLEEIDKLYIYPEDRECKRPTSSIMFDRFANVSRYELREKGAIVEQYRDELSRSQKEILQTLGMDESSYWDT